MGAGDLPTVLAALIVGVKKELQEQEDALAAEQRRREEERQGLEALLRKGEEERAELETQRVALSDQVAALLEDAAQASARATQHHISMEQVCVLFLLSHGPSHTHTCCPSPTLPQAKQQYESVIQAAQEEMLTANAALADVRRELSLLETV